ncbi:hypothetical protein QQ045_001451 [Rhodiola kirilowii]
MARKCRCIIPVLRKKMDEMRLKLLLGEYGLKFEGSLDQLREYAIGTFLWPDQL